MHLAQLSSLLASDWVLLGCGSSCCSTLTLRSSPRHDSSHSSSRRLAVRGASFPARNPGAQAPCWDPGRAGLVPAKRLCATAFLSAPLQRVSWWGGLCPAVQAAWQRSREEGWK